MRRRMFTFAATVSALLFAAVCILWVRSHLVRDYSWTWVPWGSKAGVGQYLKLDLDSGGGQLELAWKVWTATNREQLKQRNELAGQNFYHRAFDNHQLPSSWDPNLFKYYTGPTHSSFSFPHWSAALLSGILPTAWAVAFMLKRRGAKAGHCRACGYDLRASPGNCPECGTVPNQSAVTTKS